nr:tRNA-intron endonuclease [Cryptococcus depauperatus CBS 7855]
MSSQQQKDLAPRARHAYNNQKYGTPLPIILPNASSSPSFLSHFFSAFSGSCNSVQVDQVVGKWDQVTQSVWVTDARGMKTLFQKGFFGKGSLSRSEPSWKERRLGLLKGGDTLAAEQMREKRRLERKQFKIDRAQAMLDAAKKAEAIISASKSGGSVPFLVSETQEENQNSETEEDGDVSMVTEPELKMGRTVLSPSPSAVTAATLAIGDIDTSNLTPQTFLVRPTRPDANRNRGRNAFRRRPPQSQQAKNQDLPQNQAVLEVEAVPSLDSLRQQASEEEQDLFDESVVEDMEHLQLSIEESIFLSLALGVLKVYDPLSDTYPPLGPSLLSLLLPLPSLCPFPSKPDEAKAPLLPDNPGLVSYVVYHHFRSLGWVVKDGIKFCCDWLLYRRGPVFSHSAFACVIIPVYSDPNDQSTSVYGKEDWYEERMSWKWMNTVIRVNALVQKNVIAVYVTIPALSEFPANQKLPDRTLDPFKVSLKSLLSKFTVREVALTRFGATRRRD